MLKPEIDSLVPHVPFNRRTFIKAALGTGFAAAVLPVSAQTIHTDSDGLEAGERGGRIAWLYAEHNPRLKAGVAWYGRITGQKTANTPENPLDEVAQLHAPVLGLYGRQDQSIPQDTLEQMKQAIEQGPEAGRGSQFVVYDDAGHAFFADYRPSYKKADAADGWRRALVWFKQHGVS